MARVCTVQAPAKVNLTLRIGVLREDGYHEIDSLVHFVGLYDSLRVSVRSSPHVDIRVMGNAGVSEREDLCFKAADAFIRSAGIERSVHISVVKRIPMGAGLGGGSSDCSAVLLALSRLLPDAGIDITSLAASLGSDVPLFLSGPATRVSGRGERTVPEAPLTGKFAVIVDSGEHVSSRSAYRWLDELRSAGRGTARCTRSFVASAPGNDFEDVVAERFPRIRAAIRTLRETDAEYAGLTGSGGCVFGVYADRASAGRAVRSISTENQWIVPFLESTISPVLQ